MAGRVDRTAHFRIGLRQWTAATRTRYSPAVYYDAPALQEFVRWLAATPTSLWLQSVTSRIPVLLASVQTLHLLGMSVVIAANGFMAIGLLGGLQGRDALASLSRRVVPWVMGALAVMLTTGLILIVRWPQRILLSPAFLPKLVLEAVGIALLACTARSVRGNPGIKVGSVAATALALLLLIVWTGAVIAGRWIPFA